MLDAAGATYSGFGVEPGEPEREDVLWPVPHDLPDLTGQRFGRLLIVGWKAHHQDAGGRWLAYCSCGGQEWRRTKSLQAMAPENDGCLSCSQGRAMEARQERLIALEHHEAPPGHVRGCTGKVRHETQANAERVTRRLVRAHGGGREVYRCRHCHGWHLTGG